MRDNHGMIIAVLPESKHLHLVPTWQPWHDRCSACFYFIFFLDTILAVLSEANSGCVGRLHDSYGMKHMMTVCRTCTQLAWQCYVLLFFRLSSYAPAHADVEQAGGERTNVVAHAACPESALVGCCRLKR